MELSLFNVLVIAAHQRIYSISKEHLPICSPTDFFTTVSHTLGLIILIEGLIRFF